MKKAALNDKWLVLFVCMTIAGGDFSYALPVLNSGVPTPLAPQNNLQMFTLPEHLGSVQELKDAGKNRPLIFYIQDAHGLKDSQENIQKLILYFQEHYRISVVGVEGARDEIDPTLLRTFPDEFIKKKVLNSYLKLGEVSGVDLAAALNPQRGKFYGIEDWPLYQENYAAYAEADKNQKEILEVIDKLKVEAEVERRNIYSVELGRFHEKTDAFQEEKLGILELADFLNGMEKKHAPSERQISESKTPHLWKLISAVQSDGGEPRDLDTAIRQMSDRFKKKLFSRLRLDKQREFNKQYQDYVTGMTDPGAYLKFLMDLGKEVGAKPKLSRGMRELLGQVETFSMIKGTQLFKELNEVLVSWEKVLTVSEEERKLAEKFTRLRMLKTIAKLELTREQLEDYQKDPEGHLALLGDKRALLSPALSFYQAALERDNAFMVKIKRILKKENVNAMVVLTGGFHSEGMRRHLKSGDWSYAIITPKINSLEGHDSYRNAMTGKLSYQKYLKKSFYDAFMQHAVFQLVKDYNEPEFKQNVKVWRDTVIKEMAAEGRLADAGEYTAYIDRLIAVYKEKYGDQIRIEKSREEILSAVKSELENFNEKKVKAISANLNQKVNWFMSAVNKLQEAGKWDQDNFSKLLKSADARGSGLAAIEAMANKRAGDGLLNFRNGETGLEDFAKRFGRESSQFGSAAVTAEDMAANVGSLLNLTDTFARLLERLQKQADVSESGTEQGSAELYVKAAGELTELARREFPDLSEDVIPVITRQAFNQAVERILPATVVTSRSEVRQISSGDKARFLPDANDVTIRGKSVAEIVRSLVRKRERKIAAEKIKDTARAAQEQKEIDDLVRAVLLNVTTAVKTDLPGAILMFRTLENRMNSALFTDQSKQLEGAKTQIFDSRLNREVTLGRGTYTLLQIVDMLEGESNTIGIALYTRLTDSEKYVLRQFLTPASQARLAADEIISEEAQGIIEKIAGDAAMDLEKRSSIIQELEVKVFAAGKQVSAFGTNNSFDTLLRIVLEGRIRASKNGPLTDGNGDPAVFAGVHGPYYVLVKDGAGWQKRKNFIGYLVPSGADKRAIVALVEKAAEREPELFGEIAKNIRTEIFTYAEFVASRSEARAAPELTALFNGILNNLQDENALRTAEQAVLDAVSDTGSDVRPLITFFLNEFTTANDADHFSTAAIGLNLILQSLSQVMMTNPKIPGPYEKFSELQDIFRFSLRFLEDPPAFASKNALHSLRTNILSVWKYPSVLPVVFEIMEEINLERAQAVNEKNTAKANRYEELLQRLVNILAQASASAPFDPNAAYLPQSERNDRVKTFNDIAAKINPFAAALSGTELDRLNKKGGVSDFSYAFRDSTERYPFSGIGFQNVENLQLKAVLYLGHLASSVNANQISYLRESGKSVDRNLVLLIVMKKLISDKERLDEFFLNRVNGKDAQEQKAIRNRSLSETQKLALEYIRLLEALFSGLRSEDVKKLSNIIFYTDDEMRDNFPGTDAKKLRGRAAERVFWLSKFGNPTAISILKAEPKLASKLEKEWGRQVEGLNLSRSEVRVEDSKSGGPFNYGPNRTVLQRFLSSSVPSRQDYNASVNALIQIVKSQKISFVALYTQIMKDFPAAERERAGQLVFLVQKSLDFYPDGREVQLVKIGKSADSPLMPFPVEFYQGTMNASISDSDALKPGLDGMIWLSGNPNDRTVLGLAGFNPDGTPKEGVIPGKVLKRRYALKDGQIGFGEVNPGNDLTAESALADAKVQGIQARYSEENQWLMIVEHMNDPEMVYGINQARVKKGLPLIVGTEADFKARSKSNGAAPVSMSGKGQTSSGKGQLKAASQSAKTGKPADLKLSVSFEAFKPLTQVKSKKDVMPEQWAAAVNEILRALAAQNGTKLTPAIVTQLQLQYGSVIREEILSDLISYSVTALRVLGDAGERSVQMVKINQRGDLGPMPRIFYKNVNEKSADGVTPLYFNKPKQGTYEAVEVLFKPQQIIESNIIARADISAANLQGGTAAYYNDMNQSVLYFAAKNPAAAQAEFRAARSELRANAYSGEINIPQLAEGQLRNAPQEFLDKGGWKLHLTVSKANAQKVHEWLWKNTKAGYKYGRNSGQEGKDFTIYVGSRSEANEIADKLVKEIADLLSPASGAALTDDMPMTESSSAFVLGRFDTNRRRVGENNADFNQYGAKGLPFLEGDYKEVSGIAIWGTDEEKKELERKQTEARDRAYKVLEKAYGDYFTGAPSGNDRRSFPQLKEGQLKDASEEFLEKGGWKLHLTVSKANAQKVHEWLWENIQSGYKYGKNSGQEGKDFTIYVGSRKEANEIADKMVREIAHLLSPASGSALTDDMPLTEGSASLVLGRFDTNRKRIGENAVEFNQYGAKGLPFLEGDYKEISGIAIWGTDEEKEELENKKSKAGQRAYKVLEGAYGEYFTGVPAAAPREEKIKVSIKSADDGNPITSEDKLLVSRALSVKGDNILQAAGKGNVKSVSVRRVLAQIFPGAPIIRSYYFSVTLQNGSIVEYQVSYRENKDKWELMSRSELRQREDEVGEISNAGQERSEVRRTAKYRLGFDDPDMARKFVNNPNGELLKKGAEGYVSRVEGAALAAGETIQTRLNQAVTLNDLLTIIESPELEKIALSSYSEGVLSVEFAPDEVLGAVAVLRGIPYGFFDQTAALFEAGQINAEAIDTFGAELDGLIGTNLNKDQTLGLVVAENQDLELTSKAVQTFIDEQVVGRLVLMYPEALKGMKPKIFKIANLSYVKTGANLAEDIAQVDQSEENRMGTPVSFMSNVLADLSKLSEQTTGKVISANTSAIGDKKLQLTVIKTAIYVSLLLRQLEEAERKKLMKSPEAFKAFLEKNGLASVSGSILFGKQGVAVELAQFAAAFKAAAASA